MKNNLIQLSIIFALATATACGPKKEIKEKVDIEVSYTYATTVSLMKGTNAPALQSFAHGSIGSEWILLAGRTNKNDSIGGLHNLKANYADSSFIPRSFNGDMYWYDISNQSTPAMSINFADLITVLRDNFCPIIGLSDKSGCESYLNNLLDVFNSSNPLVTQNGDFLYVLGGYGPLGGDTNNYQTFNRLAQIHLPTAMNVVKGKHNQISDEQWQNFIRIGVDPTNTLVSTGAEMFYINDTFYLAGGHNFGASASSGGQKYLDAVYAFTIADKGAFELDLNVQGFISDKTHPKDSISDITSIFRRRDGPVVPALFKNPSTGNLDQGLTFYGGVFKNGHPLEAWNDAIYVHPSWSTSAKNYTYDSTYNQNNHNLYACGNFVAYDSLSGEVHTFLYGGIGTGSYSGPNKLSGFTNNAMHITLDLAKMASSNEVITDIFKSDTTKIYGAESVLILKDELTYYKTYAGVTTEIIDLATTFKNGDSIDVGYIYGGIEAFSQNPGNYGPKNSAASNKIWSVTLTRKAIK